MMGRAPQPFLPTDLRKALAEWVANVDAFERTYPKDNYLSGAEATLYKVAKHHLNLRPQKQWSKT